MSIDTLSPAAGEDAPFDGRLGDLPLPFACRVIPERERVRVSPAGELDLASAPQLAQTIRELHESGFDQLTLDLRDVTFLDSTGLRLILDVHSRARDGRLCLELLAGPPQVQRIFELTGTLAHLPFRRA